MIPRSLEEEIEENEAKTTPQVLGRPGMHEFKRSNTTSVNQIDFGAFKMWRLDLLHEENQKQSQMLKRYFKREN